MEEAQGHFAQRGEGDHVIVGKDRFSELSPSDLRELEGSVEISS